ncbi:hypothetical protein BX600DRAFT_403681 [Xylariales sp. PMI_506]|nr:hypothetical protein BX600DRAFT_403681 [Xylariales sp. PMI_506]
MDQSTNPQESPASTHPPASAPAAASAGRQQRMSRSCVICHRRKVRCDKKLPCSNCTRAWVLCCYPSQERTEPRKSRATISDVAARLGQLERTIIALSTNDFTQHDPDPPSATSTTSAPAASAASQDAEADSVSVEGYLVKEGESSHYVNEVLFSRVLEEEKGIRSLLTASMMSNQAPAVNLPAHSWEPLRLLYQPAAPARRNLKSLHPQKWQAVRLWQIYIQTVSIQSKLLHVPSFQITLYETIDGLKQPTPEVEALMFAIYFSSVVSMSPEETAHLLGQDKATALDSFRLGLELSLSAGSVLINPSIAGLQALCIYIQVVRAIHPGRQVWVLLGLVMRAAQSIGLHRDPSKFTVTPFEAEMRRRLWWHLVSLDSRTAEDHGLFLDGIDFSTDTALPLTIDDSDLDPAMTEPPKASQNRWTEMTFTNATHIASDGSLQLCRLVKNPFSSSFISESTRRDHITRLEARVEAITEHCNPAVPVQRIAKLFSRLNVGKVDFVMRLLRRHMAATAAAVSSSATSPAPVVGDSKTGGESPGYLSTDATPTIPISVSTISPITDEETLSEACNLVEQVMVIATDEMLRDYRMCCEMYPQYHAIMYILWHLCVRPDTPAATRAWAAVDGAFTLDMARIRRQGAVAVASGLTSKWRVLHAMREKAMQVHGLVNKEGTDADTHSTEPSAEGSGPPFGGGGVNGGGTVDMNTDAFMMEDIVDESFGWEGGFVDWRALINNLEVRP